MSKVSCWSFSALKLALVVGLIALAGANVQAQNQTISGHLHVTGDTSLSGDLNVTGVAELNSNVTNFGSNGANAATPGLVLTYTDTASGTISTITLATSGTTANWQWERNSANGLLPQMTLTGTNSIILWNPTVSNSAGIILNPAGDSTFSGSITATGSNSRLPNQQITTDTASVLTVNAGDGRYLKPTGNGSALTGLNASNITTGVLGDARLSSNVSLLNGNQTFTGHNTLTGTVNAFTSTFGVYNAYTMQSVVPNGISQFKIMNGTGGPFAGFFLNGTARTDDGGANTLSFFNDAGGLRLRSSGGDLVFATKSYPGVDTVTVSNSSGDMTLNIGNLIVPVAGKGIRIKEGGASNIWTLRGSTNSTTLTFDYNNTQTPLSVSTNSISVSSALNVVGATTLNGPVTVTGSSSKLIVTGTNSTRIAQQGDLSMGEFTAEPAQ
ncbi:MAG: hypothetical protein B9S32_03060 [Verrucomicrobia bacterium Tous-C9LFEB]|nr:MAG: hypothetical protein B9S32_03060 [Verrucomicrobia bacterium Tous-C9LFEB]